MYLKELHLFNFKNFSETDFQFSDSVNCIIGDNGSGKTNLLDAIHYLSMCKSFINPVDYQNIRHDSEYFMVKGIFFTPEDKSTVSCVFRRGEKKSFRFNQKEYDRLADHIGIFPVVVIAPNDSALVTEGSEERRKLVDGIISQFDRNYLDNLIHYNKALAQRNALLKSVSRNGGLKDIDLEIWDEMLCNYGPAIYKQRKDFVKKFIEFFQPLFNELTGGKEQVSIAYESQLHRSSMKNLLEESLRKDLAMEYTTVGIHKDDMVFNIGGFPVKKFGSQGQQKSFLIALKLAQFQFIKEIKKFDPILLLDDIFEKLDPERIENLMKIVSHEAFGQIFITDSHPERSVTVFQNIDVEVKVISIKDGMLQPFENAAL